MRPSSRRCTSGRSTAPAIRTARRIWQEQLDSGAMDRATVAADFAASEEAKAKFDYVKIVGIVDQTNDDIV